MRIEAKILEFGATENDFKRVSQVTFSQDETIDLFFQFVDKDKDGLRYIPASSATVLVEIARFPEVFGTISNVREVKDFSVRQAAVEAFSGDRSVWKTPLTAIQTAEMMSSNVRITLTEGSEVKISLVQQALIVIPSEGQS